MNRLIWLALVVAILTSGCGVQSPPPLQVATTNLPSAVVQQSYRARVATIGGDAPLSWSISSGQLPAGVTLSAATGDIFGTPVDPGDYDFAVQIIDSGAPWRQTAYHRFTLRVRKHWPVISTTALPSGTVQVPYTAALAATGGTTPYSWSVVAGSLPPGLALGGSTGAITGTPSASGQYSFTVQVTDSAASPKTATQALSLNIAGSPLQITTVTLPAGAVGVNYNATLAATNGVPPYTWSITGGQFPPGLALLASTGQISGTPAQAGAFTFLVQAKDSSGQTASTGFSINIAPATSPIVSSVSPNSAPTSGGTSATIGGANFQAGATVLFGGVAAPSASVTSSPQIQAVTPPHPAGTVDVTVKNPDGQSSTLAGGFVYNSVAPTVTGASPNTGPATGGTQVLVTGTNFLAGALVLFGGAHASAVTVNSATQIQAVTAASAAGAVDVTVQNPDGQSGKLASGFTYTAPPSVGNPSISGVSPNSGTPGTPVTITGTNFASGATVAFGGTNAASTVFVSATQLTASVPTIATGVVDVKVTNTGGSAATLPGGFTVTKAQSLLAGMTPANFTLPSGWTLLTTQDFENGLGPHEQLAYNISVSTARAHTGTHSLQEVINATSVLGESPGGWWLYTPGIVTTGEYYMSWYSFLDPTAQMDAEGFFGLVKVDNGVGQFQELIMDTENYTGGLATTNISLWFSPQSKDPTAVECSQFPDAPKPQNCSYVGGPWNLNLGTWEQEELWIKQSTCTNGVPNNDGFVRFYINGQLREQVDKNFPAPWNGGNINGCVNMGVNPILQVGGVWTYLRHLNPRTFNKYIDDIILLKK